MRSHLLLLTIALICSIQGGPANAAGRLPAQNTITVTTATAAQIKNSIATKKGHVVVVNFWATWCSPCVAEFPSLVKLYNRYRGDGLYLITVSADMKSDIGKKVTPFLKSHKAYSTNFLMISKDPEDAINTFDPTWQGDLPRTFIFDKLGKLAKTLTGEQTYQAFVDAVKPLMGK